MLPENLKIKHMTSRRSLWPRWQRWHLAAAAMGALAGIGSAGVYASTISGIGLAGLPSGLNGSGVNVAQVEANFSASPTDQFEAKLSSTSIANPGLSITYIDFNGTQSTTVGNTYTSNSIHYYDTESDHADSVGGYFYGSNGVAPNVAHIDNYDASYFQSSIIGHASYNNNTKTWNQPTTLNNDKVVNQSFINNFPSNSSSSYVNNAQAAIDAQYDNYTNTYNTIFVSAVGNGNLDVEAGTGSRINPPATAYNSIAVGAYPYSSSTTGLGPTSDGRDAPVIVAPASATSYSTPMVSGAAAIMVQAGQNADGYLAGDGFANQTAYVNAATDNRTVKALLINGAVKPTGWTNSYTISGSTYTYNAPTAITTTPLDPRYGSGVLNVDNSYNNLAAGRVQASAVNNSPTVITSPTITQTQGWDFSTITAGGSADIAHYVFNLSNASTAYDLTTTLTWNAQTLVQLNNFTEALNHINLKFYNSTGSLLASSSSAVDNLQQLYLLNLAPGTYDLQLVDNGGATWANALSGAPPPSATDPYAMAFDFQAVPEPAVVLLMLPGLAVLLLRRRKTLSSSKSRR